MNLEEHLVESASREYSRKVWLLPPRDGPMERVALFLDGEYYLNQMDAPSTVMELQRSGSLPPMLSVFVSHLDAEARHHDLICNSRYSEFIAVDLMRWLHQRYDDLPDHGHLIAGPSLGGLAAAYAALAYPQVFSHCLSHSGSFWWQDEWLTHQLDFLPHSTGKFWISVGDKETQTGITHAPSGMRQDIAQLDACERFANSLTERGHIAHYHLFKGSHSTQPWKEELPTALQWLLGKNELS